MIRIVFDEARFRQLVAGQVVVVHQSHKRIELILSDIGWAQMMRAVLDGVTPGLPKGPPDPPQAREFLPNRFTRPV